MGLQFLNVNENEDPDSHILRRMPFGSPFQEGSKIFKNIHSLLKSSSKKDDTNQTFNNSPTNTKVVLDDDQYESEDGSMPVSPTRSKKLPMNSSENRKSLPLNDISNNLNNILLNENTATKCDIDQSLNNHISSLKLESPKRSSILFRNQFTENNIKNFRKSPNHDPRRYNDDDEDDDGHDDDIILNTKGSNLFHNQDKRILKTRSNSLRRIHSNSSHRELDIGRQKFSHRKRTGSVVIDVQNLRSDIILNNRNSSENNNLFSSDTNEQTDTKVTNLFTSVLADSKIPFYYNKDNTDKDNFPRISSNTLHDIIENKIYKSHYQSYLIIDARFNYEFSGGHISNALNISTKDTLEWELLNESRLKANKNEKPTLVIFHCEFSCYRSPIMASHLRNCDRILNFENYPSLNYPDILILDGGYKSYFEKFSSQCYPCNYIAMESQENLVNCEQELHKFRSESKKVVSRSNSLYRLSSISRSTSLLKPSTISTNPRQEFSKSKLFKSKTECIQFNPFQSDLKPPPPKSIFTRNNSYSSKESLFNSSPDSRFSFRSSMDSNNDLSIFNQHRDDLDDSSYNDDYHHLKTAGNHSNILHEKDERDITICLEDQ